MLEQTHSHLQSAALPPMNCVLGTADQLQGLGLSCFDLIVARPVRVIFAWRAWRKSVYSWRIQPIPVKIAPVQKTMHSLKFDECFFIALP